MVIKFITKTKYPLLRGAEGTIELSNGEQYKFFSKYGRYIEFNLESDELCIDFKVLSKNFLKTSYGAFIGDNIILQIHTGFGDTVEVANQHYKFVGFFKNSIKELGFFCSPKPLLIGHEFKGSFPEQFKIQGVTLASYRLLKHWLKE